MIQILQSLLRIKIFSIFILFFIFYLFYGVQKSFAAETGFISPTSCETNGSSCEAMGMQDNNYNTWSSGTKEILAGFSDFNIPNEAIIDDIQIKLRVRSTLGGTGNGQTWHLYKNIDGERRSVEGCEATDGWCFLQQEARLTL